MFIRIINMKKYKVLWWSRLLGGTKVKSFDSLSAAKSFYEWAVFKRLPKLRLLNPDGSDYYP